MPNENDQNNGFTSRFYMSTPIEGEEPLVERYDIEALRLVDDESRRPVNIGDSTHPVYFLNGVPAQCSGGGGGGGGSDVAIYPKYKGGTLIANFSVDGQNGRIYSPTVAEVYKKATLWPPAGSTSIFSEVGDNNNSNPFKTMISSYEFLLIHYAPTNSLSEERTMMLDAQSLKNSLPDNAIFSCHYLSDVFIKCKFTSQDKFEVIESEGIPLETGENPTMLKCAIKKIEGLQFGASGEDLDQGLTVKQVLWEGTANQLDTYVFKTGTVESYNYIYLHFYASNNRYEERILVLDQEAIINGLAQDPSEANFTCDISDDLYIKGQFNTTSRFTITEIHTKTMPGGDIVVPTLCQIDGICMGSVGTITTEGGDTSDCMKKGIDYVTAGKADESEIGQHATAEGYETNAYGDFSHVEGYYTSAGATSHAEGSYTYAENRSHAEGNSTTADGDGSHAEGNGTYAKDRSHAEGYSTYAYSYGHAEGFFTTAYSGGHAEGNYTYANGSYTHAEGSETTCYGGHAEGRYTYSSGEGAHIEGVGQWGIPSVAIGNGAHAEGYTCSAIGGSYFGGHAEGYETYACDGYGPHAEGYRSTAIGYYAHAEGFGTYACGNDAIPQHVQGRYNIIDSSNDKAFIIGNGVGDLQRSNLFSIDWNSNINANALTQGSSRKIKENIKSMEQKEAEKLLQLRPVSFDYIEGEGDKNCYGLIAEEVQEIGLNYPVFEGTMRSKDEECLQLDYSKFVPYLIKMIQIQEERINNLEKELERKGVK